MGVKGLKYFSKTLLLITSRTVEFFVLVLSVLYFVAFVSFVNKQTCYVMLLRSYLL